MASKGQESIGYDPVHKGGMVATIPPIPGGMVKSAKSRGVWSMGGMGGMVDFEEGVWSPRPPVGSRKFSRFLY